MSSHSQQFQAIQSMLAAGHRCVHLERHTLLLLGGMGGFLSATTEWVITDTRFPDVAQRGVALLVWLAFWLGGMSLLEYRLTKRARERRSETLPFAQAQITRAWWMLLSVGCLGSFAMFFYGGGSMMYALWTVLLGLGIYLFGLFSRTLIEWIGLATILLGVAGLASGLPYETTRWLNAACFAIGMPLTGWLNARVGDANLPRRLLALAVWLVVVATPPLLVTRFSQTTIPDAVAVNAGAPIGSGEQVLRLLPGSRIPFRVDLDSPILTLSPKAVLEMTLSRPVEVVFQDGKPDGRYRIGDGAWHEVRDGVLHLRIDHITTRVADGQPEVLAHGSFGGAEFKGEQP